MSFGPVLADAPTQLPLIFDATPLDIWHSSSSIRRPREKNICLQKAVCSAGTAMESRTRKQRPQKNAKKFDGLLTSSSEAFKHASLEPPLLQLLALISRTLKTKTKVYHGSSHQVPSAPRDGYVWRKYGQKPLVGTTLTRAYYRCAQNKATQCMCKSTVDSDRETGELMMQKYTNEHNHPVEDVLRKNQIRKSALTARILEDLIASPIHHEDSVLDIPLDTPRSRRRFSASAFSSASDATDEWSLGSPSAETIESNQVEAEKCSNLVAKVHAQRLYLEPSEGQSDDYDSAALVEDLENSFGAQSHLNLFPQDDGELYSGINAMSPSARTRRPPDDALEPLASTSQVRDLPIKDAGPSQELTEMGSKSTSLPAVELYSSYFDSRDWISNDQPVNLYAPECWEDTRAFEQKCYAPSGGDELSSWFADSMGSGDSGNALDACGIFESAGDQQIWASLEAL